MTKFFQEVEYQYKSGAKFDQSFALFLYLPWFCFICAAFDLSPVL